VIEAGHCVVSFAGQIVGVEWSGARARAITEMALGGPANGSSALPDSIYRVGSRADTSVLTVFHGADCLYRGDSAGTAAHLLLQAALDGLIRQVDQGIVLHAALLARGARGVLLPGASGSGKTMLAAWLSRCGLDPLSDEAAHLSEEAEDAESFARPFCFKGPWLEPLGLGDVDPQSVLCDDGVTLVPRQILNPTAQAPTVVPRLIVFPHFQAGAAFALERLTQGRAAVRLLETVANARNLSDLGAGRVTALVRQVEAYSLTYGSFAQLDPLLERIEALS
jgi:hypothetical protein